MILLEIPKENDKSESLLCKMMNMIQTQTLEIIELIRQVRILQCLLEASSNTQNLQIESLTERYNLELPVKTEEDFNKLEENLEREHSFKKEFVSHDSLFNILLYFVLFLCITFN